MHFVYNHNMELYNSFLLGPQSTLQALNVYGSITAETTLNLQMCKERYGRVIVFIILVSRHSLCYTYEQELCLP